MLLYFVIDDARDKYCTIGQDEKLLNAKMFGEADNEKV